MKFTIQTNVMSQTVSSVVFNFNYSTQLEVLIPCSLVVCKTVDIFATTTVTVTLESAIHVSYFSPGAVQTQKGELDNCFKGTTAIFGVNSVTIRSNFTKTC